MVRNLRSVLSRLMKAGDPKRYLLYAVGEIVLIVIGILLALEINNANVARNDRDRETKYLRNIRIDLQRDVESLRYNIDFRERRIASTKRLLERIDGEAGDADELAKAVTVTLYEERFTPSNVTVRDLLGSGSMNLITSAAIKESLFALELMYQTNLAYIDHETYEYREYTSRPIYTLADLQRIKPVFLGEKSAAQVGLVPADFAALLDCHEYKNGCVISVWTSEEFLALYRELLETSQRVVEQIDAELKSR